MKLLLFLTLLYTACSAQYCIIDDTVEGFSTCDGLYKNPTPCNFYYAAGRWVDEYSAFRWSTVFQPVYNGSVVSCTMFGKRSIDCEANLLVNNTKVKYTGSDDFCFYYTCSIPEFGSCTCEMGELEEYAYALVDNAWSRIESYQAKICATPYKIEEIYDYSYSSGSKRSSRSLMSLPGIPDVVIEVVNVEFTKPKISFGFVNSAQRFVMVYSGQYSQYFACNSTSLIVELPDSVLIKSGTINYSVYGANAALINSGKIDYIADFMCRVKDCTLCWDAFNNWDCVPLTSKLLVGFLLAILALLALALSPWGLLGLLTLIKWLFKSLYTVFFFILWGVKKSWALSLNNRLSRSIYNAKKNVMKEFEEDQQKRSEREELDKLDELKEIGKVEERKTVGVNMPNGSRMFTTLFFCCLITSSFACDSLIIGTASYLNCLSPTPDQLLAGVQTCNAQFSITAALPNLGSTVCIDLKDQQGNFLTTFNATYTDVREYVSLSLDYVTAGWTPYAQSAYKCWGTPECSGTNCDHTTNDGYGLLSGYSVQYPGQTTCRYSGGCAGNGCFFCTAGCVYSAWGLKPYGNTFSVFRPMSRRLEPSVMFCRQNSTSITGNSCVSITQSSGSVTTTDYTGMQIQTVVVGTLTGDATIFGTNKIISGGSNNVVIQPSADPNSPVAGGMGDVQGTPSQFWTVDRNAFVYASGLYTIAQGETTDVYTFRNNGIETFGVGVTNLPGIYGGVLYSQDLTNGRLVGVNSAPGSLILNFRTPGNVTFIQKTTWVCPEARLITVSGCYSCTIGSSLVLEVRSTCFEGLVRIGTNEPSISLNTGSFNVGLIKQNITISFTTSKQQNNFDLWVWGSGKNVTVNISFNAIRVDTVINSTYNGNVTEILDKTGGVDTSSGNSFTDFFTKDIPKFFDDVVSGTASWWKYLIFAVFIAGALLVIILIAKPTIGLVKSVKIRRKGYNKVN